MTRALPSIVIVVCSLIPSVALAQIPTDPPETEHFVARIDEVINEETSEHAGIERTVQTLRMEIESGPNKGGMFTFKNGVIQERNDMLLKPGEKVVMQTFVGFDGNVQYILKEKLRLTPLWITLVLFIVLTFLLGGLTGLYSLLGLAASILVLAMFVVPMIINAADPLIVSLIGSYVIACTAIYIAHGFSKRTSVAVLSTIITLTISAVLAIATVYACKLFGMGSEESMFLQVGTTQLVNLRGLLLGGMIIGALGVLDDITTAQAATIHEIKKANPNMSFAETYEAGKSVGREHIASLINTLALAYVGSSLPLLLLFTMNEDIPLWVTLNSEFVAEEVVRTLVGSTTLLLAVPITTWLATKMLTGDPSEGPAGHAHSHAH